MTITIGNLFHPLRIGLVVGAGGEIGLETSKEFQKSQEFY